MENVCLFVQTISSVDLFHPVSFFVLGPHLEICSRVTPDSTLRNYWQCLGQPYGKLGIGNVQGKRSALWDISLAPVPDKRNVTSSLSSGDKSFSFFLVFLLLFSKLKNTTQNP